MALVLSRRVGQRIIVGGNVVIEVAAVRSGNVVSLAITAPSNVEILREELKEETVQRSQAVEGRFMKFAGYYS